MLCFLLIAIPLDATSLLPHPQNSEVSFVSVYLFCICWEVETNLCWSPPAVCAHFVHVFLFLNVTYQAHRVDIKGRLSLIAPFFPSSCNELLRVFLLIVFVSNSLASRILHLLFPCFWYEFFQEVILDPPSLD